MHRSFRQSLDFIIRSIISQSAKPFAFLSIEWHLLCKVQKAASMNYLLFAINFRVLSLMLRSKVYIWALVQSICKQGSLCCYDTCLLYQTHIYILKKKSLS